MNARHSQIGRIARGTLVLLAVFGCAGAHPEGPLSDAQIKAGFVYNFAKYIEWPGEAFQHKDAPFTLCMVGRDSLAGAMAALEGKSVHGRPLHLRKLATAEDLRECHLAFFSDSEERRLAQTLRGTSGPLLTVSDVDGFVDVGGGIGLVYTDERIQFEVNLPALQKANLKASSQLLKLARNVVGGRKN